MATTTNYSWTTPDDTALVKDGASAIRTLGSSIDTTTKALNPSTTLGDIEYRSSTANTNTRLAIGSTGNVLSVVGGVPAWTAPSGGLTLIGTTTFSASSAVNVNNVFSSSYSNYLIRTDFVGSATVGFNMRLRVSGADNTTSNYNNQSITAYSGTIEAGRGASQTNFSLTAASADGNFMSLEVFNPFETAKTGVMANTLQYAGTTIELVRSNHAFNATTSFTGFSLIPSSGNVTGTLRVYGLAN